MREVASCRAELGGRDPTARAPPPDRPPQGPDGQPAAQTRCPRSQNQLLDKELPRHEGAVPREGHVEASRGRGGSSEDVWLSRPPLWPVGAQLPGELWEPGENVPQCCPPQGARILSPNSHQGLPGAPETWHIGPAPGGRGSECQAPGVCKPNPSRTPPSTKPNHHRPAARSLGPWLSGHHCPHHRYHVLTASSMSSMTILFSPHSNPRR